MTKKQIFVDTWAWYALTDVNDVDHQLAEKINDCLLKDGYFFVTTNYVLAESVTLIRYKMYHSVAVQFYNTIQKLIESGLVKLMRINEEHETTAWKIFEKYNDQNFSFVDCTSFAVMQNLNLSEVFTADHHFETMGFILSIF